MEYHEDSGRFLNIKEVAAQLYEQGKFTNPQKLPLRPVQKVLERLIEGEPRTQNDEVELLSVKLSPSFQKKLSQNSETGLPTPNALTLHLLLRKHRGSSEIHIHESQVETLMQLQERITQGAKNANQQEEPFANALLILPLEVQITTSSKKERDQLHQDTVSAMDKAPYLNRKQLEQYIRATGPNKKHTINNVFKAIKQSLTEHPLHEGEHYRTFSFNNTHGNVTEVRAQISVQKQKTHIRLHYLDAEQINALEQAIRSNKQGFAFTGVDARTPSLPEGSARIIAPSIELANSPLAQEDQRRVI